MSWGSRGVFAVIRGVFGAGSRFRVGWRTGGGLGFRFSGFFGWGWGTFRFGRKTERYFKILTSFEIFLIFPVRQFEYTMC